MKRTPFIVLTTLLLAACSDSDNNNVTDTPTPPAPSASYQLTLTNLTYAQPMSPLAAYLHDGSVSAWTFGAPASVGIETLAESGDGSLWLSDAEAAGAMISASGDGIIMPGAAQTISFTVANENPLYLSMATMLVNSNDAFAGAGALHLNLAIGESISGFAPVYDAGTEANSELAATIPGPAGGGAGFDPSRDDVGDYVARHGGIVGVDDGKTDSALSHQHRFDSPVARWSVTRTE
ncbi:spondin domain-containing protein [uncultured Ferrimonas sp.]|uniref:spondin domain-containing protein n=1 Tax=uncultured Ferrimonas sp. TaxID=432640 RepID=UPI00261DE7B2|nr:spondin domain-containing protein [uncultured Ferrimonas sp.]